MKRALVIVATALSLGGCAGGFAKFQAAFTNDISVIEAKVAAFIAAVKKDAPIVLADAQEALDLACTLVPLAQSSINNLAGSISGPSSKVTAYLSAAQVATNGASKGCAAYQNTQAANLTPSQAANLTVSVWNGYMAAKQQVTAAQAAVGK